MSVSAYRIRKSITAVTLRGAREKFQCLDDGSILVPTCNPNAAGMIEARYQDERVLVFRRDLEESAERIEIEMAGSALER